MTTKLKPISFVQNSRKAIEDDHWGGILAQRGKNRPNRLGLTTVKIIRRNGSRLTVAGLDAIDGTPVLDIKPVMKEFLPREPVRQPDWSRELMKGYWKAEESSK